VQDVHRNPALLLSGLVLREGDLEDGGEECDESCEVENNGKHELIRLSL